MQTQNLQIIPRGIKPIIKASQFDVGREFQLKLYDGAVAYTPPTGTALRLDGVKPDGTVFSYTENLSLNGSTITVTTTTQMTILEGTVQCEIRMTKDNDDIGTINFDLMVEKSPINETTDLSQTEIPALVTLARMQMENAEAWAVGTKDGEPVSPDDPQYENSAKYWAQQVGGQTQDAEAWAVGTKDGVPVTSGDPQYHNNAKYYSDGVHTDAQAAAASALVSEGYATGKQNGTDVTSTSPYYHNNAAYFAGEAADAATTAANAALRAEAAVVLEPYIGANGNWYVYDFSTNAYVDTGVDATGATGNGIASIAKTSTSGLVDTYTITYTDNTTTTFTVTNGADGQNGQDGATGNGIASITKTSTSGLVDTYTILYTDGTSTTFTVTNGQNGTGAGDMLAADYDPTQAVYNEGGIAAYVAAQLSGFSTSLSGLSDVALASLATGQSLVYDATSGKWVNGSVSYSNLTNKPTLGTAAAKDSTNAVTNASTDLVESGAVFTELGTKVNKTDIAPVEDTPTASRQYVAGEQFYFNGALKEATATIAQGGTINPGTNCSDAPKVTAEIQTLTNNLDDEVETRAKLGAHNRLPLDLATIKSLNTSGTWSGNAYTVNNVTFTVNDDFSITANTSGAASATAFLALASNIKFKAEDYILSAGSSIDGQYSKYGLYLQRTGQADITTADETKKHFDLSTDTVFTNCKIFVANGESVTNLVFKPMVTLATDTYTDYAPYAMTNRELTEIIETHTLVNNVTASVNNANTWENTGISFTLTERALIQVLDSATNSGVLGVAVSNSNSSLGGSLIYEDSNITGKQLVGVLNAGTYYVWAKHATANVNNTFIVRKLMTV